MDAEEQSLVLRKDNKYFEELSHLSNSDTLYTQRCLVSPLVLLMVSTVVIRHHDPKQFGEEKVYFTLKI